MGLDHNVDRCAQIPGMDMEDRCAPRLEMAMEDRGLHLDREDHKGERLSRSGLSRTFKISDKVLLARTSANLEGIRTVASALPGGV